MTKKRKRRRKAKNVKLVAQVPKALKSAELQKIQQNTANCKNSPFWCQFFKGGMLKMKKAKQQKEAKSGEKWSKAA